MKLKHLCIALSAILLAHISSAQKSADLFDETSAKSFFEASPNLSVEARKFRKLALEAYEDGKIQDASDKITAAEYFENLAKFGKSLPPDLRIYLLASPDLLEEFISQISPKDKMDKVFEILAKINKVSAEQFRKYPRLAMAIALVFDTNPPKTWPHGQVSETLLPRILPDPAAHFATLVSMREKGKFLIPTEKLSIEEAKYLVASIASNEDREWAQKSVSVSLSNIPKLYPSINYAKIRLDQKMFDWTGDDYRLKSIKAKGGICTDQSYYTAEVSKARGVPAFIFSGAGSDGFHAWVGYMQKPGMWNFGVGRYENARFVTGHTLDPQTWENATDHALESMREGFRNGVKYKTSEIHVVFAKFFLSNGEFQKAGDAAKAAVMSDARNAEAWNTTIAALEKLGKKQAEICAVYESALRAFSKYPDIDADFRKRLIKLYRDADNPAAARKLTTSIILKNKGNRPDIAMEFARSELELDIAEGNADKLFSSYKRLLSTFKSDSAVALNGIAIPIINAVLKTDKFESSRELLKITKQVLKPAKDSLVKKAVDDIEGQLDNIIAELKKKNKKD